MITVYGGALYAPDIADSEKLEGPKYIIYGLEDPRTSQIRYIGKSTSGLKRPSEHGRKNRSSGKCKNWIKSLQNKGMTFKIKILEVLEEETLLNASERKWIAIGRELNWPLTNMTDGGEGASGCVKSPETRLKLSKSATERQSSFEVREKARQKALGHPVDEETRKKISLKLSGRKLSKTHLENIQRSLKGRVFSEDHKAKLSKAAFKRYGKDQPLVPNPVVGELV